MSREAHAEREIAKSFLTAAGTYGSDATALHLIAMNILYAGLKKNSTMRVVPSAAMGLGAVTGLASLPAKRGVGSEGERDAATD